MHQVGFGAWNWVAVIGYLVIMLLIGAYFTKRAGKDTDSFFTASGRLPSCSHWVLDLCNDIKCDYFYVYTRKGISNRLGIHRW